MTEYHMQAKKRTNHRAAKITAVVIAVILVILGVLAVYLFKDDNAGLSAKPSADALKPILTNAVTGKETELTPTQVNELLAYKIEQKKSETSALKSVYLTVNPDDTVNVYAPVTVNGMHFGITATAELEFDSTNTQLVATVKSMHVGRLGVPVGWTMDLIKNKLPAGIKANGDKIIVDSSLFTFPVEGIKSSLTVSDLKVKNGKFLLSTTGMTDIVKDYLAQAGEKLQGLLK